MLRSTSSLDANINRFSTQFLASNLATRNFEHQQIVASFIRQNSTIHNYDDSNFEIAYRSALLCSSRSLLVGKTAPSAIDFNEFYAFFKLISAGKMHIGIPIEDFAKFTFRKFDQEQKDYKLEFIGIDDNYTDIKNFSLKGEYELKKSDLVSSHVFMDSSVAVAIFFKGSPVALASLAPGSEVGELLINQLQGFKLKDRKEGNINYDQPGLRQLDWRRLLISHVEKIAKKLEFKRIAIQSAENCEWTQNPGHITYERALEVYDKVALHNGYVRDTSGNYSKLL